METPHLPTCTIEHPDPDCENPDCCAARYEAYLLGRGGRLDSGLLRGYALEKAKEWPGHFVMFPDEDVQPDIVIGGE